MSSGGVQKAKVVNSLALISAILLIIQLLPPLWFYALVLLGGGISLYELYRLFGRAGVTCYKKTGIVWGVVLGLATIATHSMLGDLYGSDIINLTLLLALFWVVSTALFRQDISLAMSALPGTIFGMLYVALPVSYLLALRTLPDGQDLASLVFIVTWARDAGAYGIGSMLGEGHVLFPKISSSKTIEGSLAGLGFALTFAFLAKWVFFPAASYLHFVVIGGVLGVFGQIGDLAESMFKRSVGVKDAGTLLPLHGGVLDRIDGLLFTAPVLYYYARFVMTK